MLKKIENMSLLCLLTWRYDKHSLAGTTLSQTYFHGSKGVRAIEVLLFQNINNLYCQFVSVCADRDGDLGTVSVDRTDRENYITYASVF